MTELKKTEWFTNGVNPVNPGMYLTRSSETKQQMYWRAFDGTHWHYGVPANNEFWPCPSYEIFVKHSILDDDYPFEWCGTVKEPTLV